MEKFFITVEVEAESYDEASDIAEGIGDNAEAIVVNVVGAADAETDNDGQTVLYLG